MFFKNVIFDLDNTLYDYDKCNEYAVKLTLDMLSKDFKQDRNILENKYKEARLSVKSLTHNTAASHNRFLYFKRLMDDLDIHVSHLQTINQFYWDAFLSEMTPYDDIIPFLQFIRKFNGKIVILTDFTLDEQITKLKKLDIISYVNKIITSEEIGVEKPSEHAFTYCLERCGLIKNETIVIGDSINKDFIGANNLKIYSFLKNYNPFYNITTKEQHTEFSTFKGLKEFFEEIEANLNNLVKLSKNYGERFDLIQQCGGNISVKMGPLMMIKSSGISLSDVSSDSGFSILDQRNLLADVMDNLSENIDKYNQFIDVRASMESYMHSLLKKYTVHLHPLLMMAYLVGVDGEDNLIDVMGRSEYKYLTIEYETPGIELADKIKCYYKNEDIIFLKNHGVIFTSDNYDQLVQLIEDTIKLFEENLEGDYVGDRGEFKKYKNVNLISKEINNFYLCDHITYLSEDIIINKLINMHDDRTIFPDKAIYCGKHFLRCDEINSEILYEHKFKYKEQPIVIILRGLVYINAKSIQRCKIIEDVLKAHLISMDSTRYFNTLNSTQIDNLLNKESEKYRQGL